jgi:hypothetical protein
MAAQEFGGGRHGPLRLILEGIQIGRIVAVVIDLPQRPEDGLEIDVAVAVELMRMHPSPDVFQMQVPQERPQIPDDAADILAHHRAMPHVEGGEDFARERAPECGQLPRGTDHVLGLLFDEQLQGGGLGRHQARQRLPEGRFLAGMRGFGFGQAGGEGEMGRTHRDRDAHASLASGGLARAIGGIEGSQAGAVRFRP